MLHITSAHYVKEFTIWIAFDDGTEGEVNLEDSFNGPVFEPLKDVEFFSRLSVDPELATVVWPNGADLAPEFLKTLYNQQHQV